MCAFAGALMVAQAMAAEQPKSLVKVKVFVAAMFEIGKNTGDRAGEFQHWYERYWMDSAPIEIRGALNPVYCNPNGVRGAVLGMGKVASSSSMQAILLNPQLDFSQAYYILSGVGGVPPSRGTIGEVVWATWLVDYDLGHRWAADEVKPGEPLFMPRKGYESIRVYRLNPSLVDWAMRLSVDTPLKDSEAANAYRMRYPQNGARRAPFVATGTHMTGDTFFHGPGMSAQAQSIAKLYGADDYVITEMEGIRHNPGYRPPIRHGPRDGPAGRGEFRPRESQGDHLTASRSGAGADRWRLCRDRREHRARRVAGGGSYRRQLVSMGRRRAVISGSIVAGDRDNGVCVPDLGRVRRGTDQPSS
jgi:purine nucleoside permease